MPGLRVLAGPTANDLTPISHIVNTFDTFSIKSERFEGIMSVHIKGFVDENGQARESAYFKGTNGNGSPKGTYAHTNVSSGTGYPAANGNGNGNGGGDASRKGVTWSIQVKGRFLQEISSDDVLFGNTFDRPLKLPWGSGAALKFMNFVDPTLEHALDSDKPWALSPLISTMPYFAIHRDEQAHKKIKPEANPAFASSHGSYLHEDVSELENVPQFKTPSSRRQYFSTANHRKEVDFKTTDIVASDFCYGFLSFPDIRLNLPGGISFDLMNYWDGQPVRFVCCERRRGTDEYGRPLKGPGDPFWVVVF
ncbi:DUF1769-domain-containing protein, partial [Serendipita vermifera]